MLDKCLLFNHVILSLSSDYKEYHTDTTVRFIIKMSAEKLANAELAGLHKFFKLQTTFSTNSMVSWGFINQRILKQISFWNIPKEWVKSVKILKLQRMRLKINLSD